jgi:hypothetical protein
MRGGWRSVEKLAGFTVLVKAGYDKVTKISGDENYAPENFGTIELCKSLWSEKL